MNEILSPIIVLVNLYQRRALSPTAFTIIIIIINNACHAPQEMGSMTHILGSCRISQYHLVFHFELGRFVMETIFEAL